MKKKNRYELTAVINRDLQITAVVDEIKLIRAKYVSKRGNHSNACICMVITNKQSNPLFVD